MPKKEKIPAPGGKDPYTGFMTKGKWKQMMQKSTLEVCGRNLRPEGGNIVGNALMKNKWVVTLDLCHNNLGDDGAIFLAQLLKVNDTLQHVSLACNGIGDVGGIAIASAFVPYPNPTGAPSQWNRGIYVLNMSGNKLSDVSLIAFANASANHRHLEKVDLSNNQIGGIGCKAFMRSMKRNPMCQFQLNNNNLGDEGATHLALALQDAPKLFEDRASFPVLNLSNNNISKSGADALGQLLGDNSVVVQDVNLAWNTLGFKGTESLVMRITTSTQMTWLRSLNLTHNLLDDDSAREVAKLISANLPTLIKINLSNNNITSAGGTELARAAQQNTHLQHLMINNNTLSDRSESRDLPVVKAFCELIKSTQSMTILALRGNSWSDGQDTEFRDAAKSKANENLRIDIAPESAESLEYFLEKLKSWQQEKLRLEEEAASKKKGKKKRGD